MLIWIVCSALAMSLIAWIGLLVLALNESQLQKVLLPLVAYSAGALMGGSLLHLLPEALARTEAHTATFLWVLLGFSLFFLMEQFLNWHHHHAVPARHTTPVTYLILAADALHNFIGGLTIAGSFLVSVHVGVVTWIAAAAHEIPQELGDFGILLHGGWAKRRALVFNFMSALTVFPGALLAYAMSAAVDTTFLLSFAAGNFVYIAASDLIPEVKHQEHFRDSVVHFLAFSGGVTTIILTRMAFGV
jgi:zinc and cadmium transporter